MMADGPEARPVWLDDSDPTGMSDSAAIPFGRAAELRAAQTARPARSRWRQVAGIALALPCWGLAILGALSLFARNIASDRAPLVMAAAAVPVATLLTLLAVVGLAAGRRWISLTVAFAILVALLVPLARPLLHSDANRTGRPLRVMTFNLQLGQADVDALLDVARSRGAQLLMLQELTEPALARLQAAGISQTYRYQYVQPGRSASGVGLFSTFPLSDKRTYPDFQLRVVSATVTLPGGTVLTAFSSHLSAPWPQDGTDWKLESARLGTLLSHTAGTVIDAGDFNATVNHKSFRSLMSAGHLTDAATAIHSSTLRTYPTDRWYGPVLGIDHVLLRGVYTHGLTAVQIRGSDHKAVITDLRLP
jgi:endonuclease/exonuclease/phosphatase (EEP) superfamily protein YafD